jgi:AraC-like DNA-binding protein
MLGNHRAFHRLARSEYTMAHSRFVPTQELSQFFDAPADRVMVRRSFCFWQSGARVRGCIAWGRQDQDDVREMFDVFDAYILSPLGGQPSLMDIRAVESVSIAAFRQLTTTFGARRRVWLARAGRQAILHDDGFSSALILGALQLAARGYELQTFTKASAALAWLGAPDVTPAFEMIRASVLDLPDVVRRVHAVLDEDASVPSVRTIARRIGLSARSLQRHLAAAGTSVREVRVEHLVRRAERLLEGSELDLTAIASTLGLGSAARLVTLFRRTRNTTPGAWRRAHHQDVTTTNNEQPWAPQLGARILRNG